MAPPRRSLALFLSLVVLSSSAVQLAIYRTGRPIDEVPWLVIALMWSPGLASIVTRLVLREGFSDVSFRLGGRPALRASAVVIAFPIVVGALAYGLAWSTGLATFEARPLGMFGEQSHPAARFAFRFALAIVPGIPLSMITALGEEIGWRGFFVTRLVDAGVRRPLLVSGLVWGAWHVPLILSGQYASGPSPAFSSVVFVLSILPAAFLFGWARFVSGSVWPAAIAHAAWNSIIQGVFDPCTKGHGSAHTTNAWVGESGVLVAVASVVVVAALLRRPFPVLRAPGRDSERTLSLRDA